MATNQIAVLGQYQACALRAIKLDADCTPATGPNNVMVTTAIARATLTPEIKTGAEVEAPTACGDFAWIARTGAKIKFWNLELEMCLWDYEFLTMIVGGSTMTGNSDVAAWNTKTIGWAAPGFNTAGANGVSLEIFSKVAYESGDCPSNSVANPPAYVRHILPKVTAQLSDRPFTEEDAAFVKLTGKVVSNPRLWVDLPEFGEWPTSTSPPSDSAYVQLWANTLPTLGSINGGFTDVTITPGS